ncbi:MAG: hypothetical protein JST89_05805 [Cyanobacteria bacterium SZAS-4]|nr:hypothetical protein [Cyanobacteria bacterium SZAS-4]
MYQILFAAVAFTTLVCSPALAGAGAAPELDGGMLSSLAAAFTGCYAAFRVYSAKRK